MCVFSVVVKKLSIEDLIFDVDKDASSSAKVQDPVLVISMTD